MGILIKEILSLASFDALTSNYDPEMIRLPYIGQAAQEFIKSIKLLELYPNHQALIDRFQLVRENYPELYAHRTLFLFQMSQTLFEITSLSLPKKDFLQANELKCQLGFMTVLFDDLCDLSDDKDALHKVILAMQGQVDQVEIELYQLIADTWLAFKNEVEQAPNYEMLASLFDEAYQLWIDSFEYSIRLRESSRLEDTWEEQLETIAHSAVLYLAGLVDLLFVPNLSAEQAVSASGVFLRTQKMAELGNWITTWGRELAQKDFTSGVFTIVLQHNWVSWDDLKDGSIELVREKIQKSPVNDYLWKEWERLRLESHEIVDKTQLSAFAGYVDSFSAIMYMELASTGQY